MTFLDRFLAPLVLVAACSAGQPDDQAADDAFVTGPGEATYVLEGYGSGSAATGVDEWDVALITRKDQRFILARGFVDPRDSKGVLLPAQRKSVIDVVTRVGNSEVWFEVPEKDQPKAVDAKTSAALLEDFAGMRAALAYQVKIASSPNAGAGVHALAASAVGTECGSGSDIAAKGIASVEKKLSAKQAASSPKSTSTAGALAGAKHACPAPEAKVSTAKGASSQPALNEVLGSAKGMKRFFERNRTLIASATKAGKAELLGLMRCIFGNVVTGVYLFAGTEVPSAGLADFIAQRGANLPGALLPKASEKLPGFAEANKLVVGAWGGLDISSGVKKPDVLGGFDVALEHGFHIPFVGELYVEEGVGFTYDFTTKEWDEPEWFAGAGDIPLSIGAVEAGLGAYVTHGDWMGIYVDFELAGGNAAWGIDVGLSKSGLASFWQTAMSGSFAAGCAAPSDE